MMRFSYYNPPIKNIYPKENILISDLYLWLKYKFENETQRLRNVKDKDEIKKIKQERLPYITVAGKFSKRNTNSLIQLSGFASIDIDGINNVHEWKNKLSKDPYIKLLFISPSSKGLKAIIQIPKSIEKFSNYVKSFYQYLHQKYDLNYSYLDSSTHDIARATFLCHDSNVYYNLNSIVFDKILEIKQPIVKKIPHKKEDRKKDGRDRSAFEFAFICQLLEQGKSKQDVWNIMNSFAEKWQERDLAYQEATYNNALSKVGGI